MAPRSLQDGPNASLPNPKGGPKRVPAGGVEHSLRPPNFGKDMSKVVVHFGVQRWPKLLKMGPNGLIQSCIILGTKRATKNKITLIQKVSCFL